MEIVDFNSFKNSVKKLDKMAQVDMTKPNAIFPQESDDSVADKMKRFFDVADGNSIWTD